MRDRRSIGRPTRTIEFEFPSLDSWDAYTAEVAEFFSVLASDFPDLYIPDKIEELREEGDYAAWASVTACIFQVKPFRDKIKSIVMKYLDPYIEGVSDYCACPKTNYWMNRNLGMEHAFYMFTAVVAVEDWLKKKSKSILQKVWKVTPSRSSLTLAKRQESQFGASRSGRSSEPGFSF